MNFRDQIYPKKEFKISTVKFQISPLSTLCTRFRFTQSSLKFQDQICVKRCFRKGIHKSNCQIQNQHPWTSLCTEFHLKQTTSKFQDKICPKKCILATDFKETTIKFRIYTPEYSFVLSFILKKTPKFWHHICPKNVF